MLERLFPSKRDPRPLAAGGIPPLACPPAAGGILPQAWPSAAGSI